MTYFTPGERQRLADIILNAVGGDYQSARMPLRADLPVRFKALMSGANATDVLALNTDLTRLNETERLDDGRVPLQLYLGTFLSIFGSAASDVDWIRLMLVRIDQTAAGAPDVDEPTVDEVKEAVVHQNDMLELSFLRSGLAAASSVAKLSVPQFQNGVQSVTGGGPVIHLGTGWIVAANLVMTNHHVINARRKGEAAAAQADFEAQALAATLTFDFDDPQVAGTVLSSEGLVAADVTLDFALIRVQAGARVALNCTRDLPTAPLGHGAAAINIIQHPSGGSKRVAIRNNLMASSNEQDLRYFTDTLSGSSGAPVFDDDWRVVALHRGHSLARGISFQGREAIYINVGTRISAILDHLLAHHQGQIPELHI